MKHGEPDGKRYLVGCHVASETRSQLRVLAARRTMEAGAPITVADLLREGIARMIGTKSDTGQR